MAATFSDFGTIAKDANFQARVYYAMIVAAVNVYAEASNTAGHPARAAYALRVLTTNFNLAAACTAVLQNPTIAAEANATVTANGGYSIPDGDIQFAVNSLWNAFSGA